jgi:tyrosyl-tRNA synthetase
VWLNAERVLALRLLAVLAQRRGRRCRRFLRLFTELPLPRSRGSRSCRARRSTRPRRSSPPRSPARARRAAATEAVDTARRTFEEGGKADTLPTVTVPRAQLADGVPAFELFHQAGLRRAAPRRAS